MGRIAEVLVAAVVAGVSVSTPTPTLVVSPERSSPSTSVVVAGTGFDDCVRSSARRINALPPAPVTVTVGTRTTQTTVGEGTAQGTFRVAITAPGTPGTYRVTARCTRRDGAGTTRASTTLTVATGQVGTAVPDLPGPGSPGGTGSIGSSGARGGGGTFGGTGGGGTAGAGAIAAIGLAVLLVGGAALVVSRRFRRAVPGRRGRAPAPGGPGRPAPQGVRPAVAHDRPDRQLLVRVRPAGLRTGRPTLRHSGGAPDVAVRVVPRPGSDTAPGRRS